MRQEILIDTGPIVAILSGRDHAHDECVEALKTVSPPLLTTWPVITEAQYLLRNSEKATAALFDGITGNLWRIVDQIIELISYASFMVKNLHASFL